jgi:hypothetical protein
MNNDIKYYLDQAKKYELLQEVVLSAIETAKDNPDYCPEVIMDMACEDWNI